MIAILEAVWCPAFPIAVHPLMDEKAARREADQKFPVHCRFFEPARSEARMALKGGERTVGDQCCVDRETNCPRAWFVSRMTQ